MQTFCLSLGSGHVLAWDLPCGGFNIKSISEKINFQNLNPFKYI